jgi:ADP-heptose:LPS heptosyltransferase
MNDRILVIKLGALGDIVLACGPFSSIRRHHIESRITLLTTSPFVDFLRPSAWFDEILVDTRPALWQVNQWVSLRRNLRSGSFDRVYDLQTSDRSGWYFRLLGPGRRPEWSGIASGCSHPHLNPNRDNLHTTDRQREQLSLAGVKDFLDPDFSWVTADTARFGLPNRYVLLAPGGSPHRLGKRWPAESFAVIAGELSSQGITPVIVGGQAERHTAEIIASAGSGVIDLVGRTTLSDLVVLGRGALTAIGNDTGPMHMIAASDCPSLVLFSAESNPALTAPRGALVKVLQHEDLSKLTPEKVADAVTMR